MTPAEELSHLREGAAQPPPGELDVLDLDCPGGAPEALDRTREVLEAVLAHTAGEWPDPATWKTVLPAWFVAACADDAEVSDCVLDRWSLRAWVYWFQPTLRRWRWWDAAVEGRRLRVRLLVLQRPYLRGALEWLLKVASGPPSG